MENKEVFQFNFQATNRQKNNWERYATINVEATDRRALENLFRSLIDQDKSGTVKEIFEKALLLHNSVSQN